MKKLLPLAELLARLSDKPAEAPVACGTGDETAKASAVCGASDKPEEKPAGEETFDKKSKQDY